MKIATVGIDLAKNVFQVHAVDERGRAVLRKQLRRDQLVAFFVNLPPCLIGMETCASAHHWARSFDEATIKHPPCRNRPGPVHG
jgi:transposase